MAININWTKQWSSSDDGTYFHGADLANIQSDIVTALTAVSASVYNQYNLAFTNTNLVKGIFTISHALSAQYVTVVIYDNNGQVIIPDSITATSTAICTVSLLSYGYGPAPAWVTSTAYAVNDYVTNSGSDYKCLIAHTSGTFATDLAAGKWVLATTPSITGTWNVKVST